MALIHLMAHAPNKSGVEATLGTAASHWQVRDYEGVVRLLEPFQNEVHAVRTEVTVEALQLLADAYRLQGDQRSALLAIERAVQVQPRSTELKMMLASAYADQGQRDAARDVYLRLAAPRDLPANMMLRIARGMNRIGEIELASQVCNWALAKSPNDAAVVFAMGIYLLRLGEPVYRTEALMIKALKICPGEPHYSAALAALMFRMDRAGEAIQILQTLDLEGFRRIQCKRCLQFLAASLFKIGETQLASLCTAASAQQKNQSLQTQTPVCFEWSMD